MRTDVEQARRDAFMEAHTAIFKAFSEMAKTNSALTSFRQDEVGPGVHMSLLIVSKLIDGPANRSVDA